MSMQQAIAGANIKCDAECATSTRTDTRRYSVAIMHAVWLVTALWGISLFIISLPARVQQLNPTNPPDLPAWFAFQTRLGYLGISRDFYTDYILAFEILFAVTFYLAAIVIFLRRPSDKMALFTSFMFLMIGVTSRPVMHTTNALANLNPAWDQVLRIMTTITWASVFIFFYVFPNGRLTAGWTRWFIPVALLLLVPANLFPDDWFPVFGKQVYVNPWHWESWQAVIVESAIWGSCIYAQVARYRNISNSLEKQQSKWILYGFAISIIGVLGFLLLPKIDPALNQPWKTESLIYQLISVAIKCLAGVAIPVAIGFSISRYRLWNIDILINRTLVYVSLTGILAGVYTASITLFQKLLIASHISSDMAVVFATLILASTFTPIKNYLQTVVDNRFKESHDPVTELQTFNKQVEAVLQVLDVHQITRRLLDEATFAMGAQGGAVYMGRDGKLSLIHSSEHWNGDAAISVSLKENGEAVGLVALGPRRSGAEYNEKDREMLQQVVDVVGKAIALSKMAA